MWQALRLEQLGVKVRRQQPIGRYIVDFIAFDVRLIVEVDGGQHADGADDERDAFLSAEGYRVLRFWNNEVLDILAGVAARIEEELAASPPP